MSKSNRTVRPRLFSTAPTLLNLACQTGLNREQIRRLGQAMTYSTDLEKVLSELPLRAVEPFLIAASLAGRPMPLEKVASIIPSLSDPFSTVRIVGATSGNRIEALLDLLKEETLEPFRIALVLYLCVDLLEGDAAPARLADALLNACEARNTWMSGVLLRDVAVRLEVTSLLRCTRPWARHLQTPAGRMLPAQLRHLVFQSPLANIPEAEHCLYPEGSSDTVCALSETDLVDAEAVQRVRIPIHLLAEGVNFETVDSRGLLLIHQLLANDQRWESAERALDELMRRGVDPAHREEFIQQLLKHGQTDMAERQVALSS